MSPPPPAMESMKPAKAAKKHSVTVSSNHPRRSETKTPSVPARDVRRVLSKQRSLSDDDAPAEGIVLFSILHAGDLVVESLRDGADLAAVDRYRVIVVPDPADGRDDSGGPGAEDLQIERASGRGRV